MCLQRLQKRNRPSEEKLASISRPKKSKEDLKRYKFMINQYYLNKWKPVN